MDWDKLRVFHAVAEAGSFTHAGDVLNLSQSAVSRQISALEDVLQVPLFHRHARGLILTEQGETLHKTVREVFSKLEMTQTLLTESKEKAAGAYGLQPQQALVTAGLCHDSISLWKPTPKLISALFWKITIWTLACVKRMWPYECTPPASRT